jgi:signal-transduction protein with cAMP-binding, CBS, and nucleotidyltransferase domain
MFHWLHVLDADAAVLMLKNKIHRIPVVNDQQQVVGKCRLELSSQSKVLANSKIGE